jgi:N-acetylglucosamine PTS system EIICBA or EIICB component
VLLVVPPEATADLSGRASELAAAAFRAKELAKLSVPAGLICGLMAGALYNRYSNIKLPAYLAFFAGRRFVPIASGFGGMILALCFGYGWPVLERGMDATSQAVLASESFGLFAYGVLNRVLIVTGLHHILNNIAWFLLGDYNGVTGDLKRFFAGDPSAGAFMSGFFPVMMFGLPAACLAMYRSALPARRKAVGGMLFSIALTSFLTGVTEPIEFSFMFLAPVLYGIHAVLTGVAHVLMDAFQARLGFGFSAGLFDYVLNFGQSTRPLLLIPIGIAYFALYYGLFRFFILRFDLRTPGRDPEEAAVQEPAIAGAAGVQGWVRALGGVRNVVSVDACTTRLRLGIADQASVDEGALRKLGARGLVRPSDKTLQVVVGPIADQLATDIRSSLKGPRPLPRSAGEGQGGGTATARALLSALGGADNVRDLRLAASRICVALKDASAVVDAEIDALAVRGIARPAANTLHIVFGPEAPAVFDAMSAAHARKE